MAEVTGHLPILAATACRMVVATLAAALVVAGARPLCPPRSTTAASGKGSCRADLGKERPTSLRYPISWRVSRS